jgi:hypothetical protein
MKGDLIDTCHYLQISQSTDWTKIERNHNNAIFQIYNKAFSSSQDKYIPTKEINNLTIFPPTLLYNNKDTMTFPTKKSHDIK